MNKCRIEIDYLKGLKMLFDNKNIVLSKEHSEDLNGYARIYFDDMGNLMESYYKYDDYGHNDGIKEKYHIINFTNDVLYVDGSIKENILKYIDMRWNINYDWDDILKILKAKYSNDLYDEIIKYLKDIYYVCIQYLDEEYFDIDEEEVKFLHYVLS